MKVQHYAKNVQIAIKSETGSAPYLHIAFKKISDSKMAYAIFVWDTRNVLESGTIHITELVEHVHKNYRNAKDSFEQLLGSGSEVQMFNKELTKLQETK